MGAKERTERYLKAQEARGMVQVKVWVPEGCQDTIKRAAELLRAGRRLESD